MINFRRAKINDLDHIILMYKDVCRYMEQNNVNIWNEEYPFKMFEADIQFQRLYVLENRQHIIGCFALCEDNDCKRSFTWKNDCLKSCYVERLAVNPIYNKQGMGSLLLKYCIQVCEYLKYDYLRLFVVDFNKPAIALYEKLGFYKVEGLHRLEATKTLTFYEYGYEYELNK